jgi:hypothetical protein
MIEALGAAFTTTLFLAIVFTALYSASGYVFGELLISTDPRLKDLIAQRGLRRTARVLRRAQQVRRRVRRRLPRRARKKLSEIDDSFWASFLIPIALLMVAWQILESTDQARGHPLAWIGALAFAATSAVWVSPWGFVRAARFTRRGYDGTGGWTVPLPELHGWVDDVRHRIESERMYRFALHVRLTAAGAASGWSVAAAITVKADLSYSGLASFLGTLALANVPLLGALPAAFVPIFVMRLVVSWRYRRLLTLFSVASVVDRINFTIPEDDRLALQERWPVRDQLIKSIKVTGRYARYLRRKQDLQVAHPVADLLDQSASHLRWYLGERESMSEEVADEVQQTVLRMAAMLAGATDAAFLNECNKRLQVLECIESTTESHRSWLRWFPNAVDMTERTGRLTLWFMAVGLLAWLVVSNRLGIAEFVQLVR